MRLSIYGMWIRIRFFPCFLRSYKEEYNGKQQETQYITTIKLYNLVLNNLITLEQNQTVFCLNLNNYKKINFALKKNTWQISKEIIDLGVKKRGEYVAPESTQIPPMKGSLLWTAFYITLEIRFGSSFLAFTTPSLLEFPLTLHGLCMVLFWSNKQQQQQQQQQLHQFLKSQLQIKQKPHSVVTQSQNNFCYYKKYK